MNTPIETVSTCNNELIMEHATILITLRCNLKCKLCSAYAPYYTDIKDPTIYMVKGALSRFFSIVSHVDKFTICGGEPFIYPHLSEVLECFLQYSSKICLLEILTNGTIIPSEKLLKQMNRHDKDKFRILIDNYGPDKSFRVKEIDEILNGSEITHSIRNYTNDNPHCGGWVDFGDLTTKKHFTASEVEAKYAKCAYPQKLGFSFAIGPDGCMFPCGPSRRCKALQVVDDKREYIDLFDETLTIAEQREKIRAVLNGKSLGACAYCNGLCDDSPRFLPAEQL